MLDVPFRILSAVSYSRQGFNGVIKIILQIKGVKKHTKTHLWQNTLTEKNRNPHEQKIKLIPLFLEAGKES